ncbi:HEAT repeat domain-containing protein [Methanosarcina sp.]|uniref:HEAT repeat domain-containing protein n=1 Tax=Methanosarcina sp. TaxID=2213 RepID=UPI002AB8BCAE|nr:HEAT repeat domain-containing protein [Methanosarcina sp.]MDY9926241.1 HEAT repeat domain-containing protein [Methanosarcina sp.]
MVGQSDVHEKTFSPSLDERTDALQQLIIFFGSFSDRQQALEDMLRLCSDEDKTLRVKAINALGTVFPELSDEEKEKGWSSLLELIRTEDPEVWKAVVLSLIFAFDYLPEKSKLWNCLLRLAEDEDRHVREHAVEALILLFPSMSDMEKVWADFIVLAGSEYGEIREPISDAFILIYPYLEDREQVWESLLEPAGSGDNHVQDRAGDIMARIFHQLPDRKKAMKDVENLTMRQMDYVARRALKLLRDDYPELSEAGNPAEELYRLAAKKAPYARWKASGTAGKGQGASGKKRKEEETEK